MKVLSTPMPVSSQNDRRLSLARVRMQPLPAMITGRVASASKLVGLLERLFVGHGASKSFHR